MSKTTRSVAAGVYLLPAFEEFIIGYSDRSAALAPGMSPKVISNNGIFRAAIVANGIVRGILKMILRNCSWGFYALFVYFLVLHSLFHIPKI